jgi:hypothetical protein
MEWVVNAMPRPCFTPSTHWTGGSVGPRAGLDTETRRKILCLCRRSKPNCPARSQTLYCLSWTIGQSRFDLRQGQIFLLAPAFRLALGPTQHPIQWVPGVLSPGVKRGRGVTLTTHPHLVPRLRMSRSYTSSPLMCLHGVWRDSFAMKFQYILDGGLLGCDAVWTCRWVSMFRGSILPPSSGMKSDKGTTYWYLNL